MMLGEEEQKVMQQHAEAWGRNSRRSKALEGEQQEVMLVEEQGLIFCVRSSSRSISW